MMINYVSLSSSIICDFNLVPGFLLFLFAYSSLIYPYLTSTGLCFVMLCEPFFHLHIIPSYLNTHIYINSQLK